MNNKTWLIVAVFGIIGLAAVLLATAAFNDYNPCPAGYDYNLGTDECLAIK